MLKRKALGFTVSLVTIGAAALILLLFSLSAHAQLYVPELLEIPPPPVHVATFEGHVEVAGNLEVWGDLALVGTARGELYGLKAVGLNGIYGVGTEIGVWGSSEAGYGVYGQSTSGYGVYGSTDNRDKAGGYFKGYQATGLAIKADGAINATGTIKAAQGIQGTHANWHGVYGESTSSDPTYAGVYAKNTAGPAIKAEGDLVVTGLKNALVSTAHYGKRKLYAMESPGCWFEDFGRGKLTNGKATIKVDPIFAETIDKDSGIIVFVQLTSPAKGTYVETNGIENFTVTELNDGKSNAAFNYRILGKRKGYATTRLEEIKEKGK